MAYVWNDGYRLDRFMNHWLLSHIVQVDRKLAAYLTEAGLDEIGFRAGD